MISRPSARGLYDPQKKMHPPHKGKRGKVLSLSDFYFKSIDLNAFKKENHQIRMFC